MKSSVLALQLIAGTTALAAQQPTWPVPVYDELEEIMNSYDGYMKSGFLDGISGCGFSSSREPGRMTAAEWVRTAYHDMATADVAAGVGGLDASILFETDRPENPGPGLPDSFGFFQNYLSARVSFADLIALGVNAAVKVCGGPHIPYRAGRKDATAAGALGVPEPQESIANFTAKFARQGFNAEEMIGLVACGHTLGGVHTSEFPSIVPNGSQPDTTAHFDSTRTMFDNAIVTEYLAGNTSNPLVVGPAETNADLRIFSSDGNVTMKGLADPKVFSDRCASLFAKMIDTVPKGVQLTPVIVPYDLKPKDTILSVVDNTTFNFAGKIRVKTTQRKDANISKVEVIYTGSDKKAQTLNAPKISPKWASYSLDDSFTWYTFSTNVSSSTGVEFFNVKITLKNGTIETYDNNGHGFPVTNLIFLQSSASCIDSWTDFHSNINTTLVAAVHATLPPPTAKVTALRNRAQASLFYALETFEREFPMQPWTGAGTPPIPKEYKWFKVTFESTVMSATRATYDIVSGSGDSAVADTFRWFSGCNPKP